MTQPHWEDLDSDLRAKLNSINDFVKNELLTMENQLHKEFIELKPRLLELRKKVKEKGLWLPQISKEYGGMGLSLVEFGYVSEILGQSPYGHYVFNCQAPDAGNMEILIDHGTEEQKEKFLYPLLEGKIRSCFSIVEPEYPGSNPTWIGATASKENGNYIVNGHKWFSTSADGSSFAVVMAMTNPDNPVKHKRTSMIIVPTDTPGFELVENIPVMGHRGQDWASHGEIKYANCKVPSSNLLGKEGEGFTMAQERLGPGRIHHAMRWLGISERAFTLMCQFAVNRNVAPNTPLASQQTIQNWIAESRAEINAARYLVLNTANKIDKHGIYAARIDISLIKFYTANMLQRVLDRALQTHGSLGMTSYTPIANWYAHERAGRIYDGPDEVHKRSVAKRILSEYKKEE